jgi:hypothetical protein
MSTLVELREEVRELVGYGVYDRNFKPEWADEGLNWACAQAAALMGLTRQDTQVSVASKSVVIPDDAIKVVSVQTVS